jgi:hypothetical protein
VPGVRSNPETSTRQRQEVFMGKRVITVADVLQAAEAGESAISVPSGECIVTPGARDKAESLEIELLEEEGGDVSSEPAPACASSGGGGSIRGNGSDGRLAGTGG